MKLRLLAAMLLAQLTAFAVIVDRIAIVVGDSIIKDSDIDRDVRVTEFLNGEPLDLSNGARKKAAARLIGQVFIRREIRMGGYPTATLQEADGQLDAIKKQRFNKAAAFEHALQRYGLTALDLRSQFQWQLSVLRFIDVRFKPAVLVSDEETAKYYREHQAALSREHPGKATLEDRRGDIQDILTGEKVNQLFFAWLDQQRQDAKIKFREDNLA